jgi:hypothetical protein
MGSLSLNIESPPPSGCNLLDLFLTHRTTCIPRIRKATATAKVFSIGELKGPYAQGISAHFQDREAGEDPDRLRADLEATGRKIGGRDTIIAAHSLALGATMVVSARPSLELPTFFGIERIADGHVGEPSQPSPHDDIPGWWVVGAAEVSAEPGDSIEIIG